MPRSDGVIESLACKKSLALLALVLPLAAQAADYKAGWTAARFYPEVAGCESAVVLPAIQSYEKKGQAAGRAEEAVRSETLSMTPVLERSASAMCFCMMNQVAKDVAYDAFAANRTILRGYAQNESCRAAATPNLTKDQAQEMRLK